MAKAFSPNGFGSRSLNSEKSISFSELNSLICPLAFDPKPITTAIQKAHHQIARILVCELISCELDYRGALATQTRERRRPALRVYFIGRRFGSILAIPAPLFTSMIWSRKRAAR